MHFVSELVTGLDGSLLGYLDSSNATCFYVQEVAANSGNLTICCSWILVFWVVTTCAYVLLYRRFGKHAE